MNVILSKMCKSFNFHDPAGNILLFDIVESAEGISVDQTTCLE